MKFLALSALAAFGFLAQNSESTLISDNILPGLGLNNPIQNLQGSNPLFSGSLTGTHLGQSTQRPINSLLPPTFQPGNNFRPLNPTFGHNPFNNNQNPFNNNQNPFNNNQNPFNNNQNPFNNNQNPFNNNQNPFNNNQNPFNNNQNPFNNNQNNVSSEILKLRSINRSFDGTGNNLKNPRWGATGSPLQRLCAPNYQDGKSIIWQNAPEPRVISNFVGQVQSPVKESSLGNNMIFTAYGQFLGHDINLTAPPDVGRPERQLMPIKIPKCDIFFDKQCTGVKSFPFARSIHTGAEVRTPINQISAWMDGNQVYGSSKKQADDLRSFRNGKMKVSQGNLLPKNQRGMFLAGDSRLNENTPLTLLHTIFVRQHNRLCDIILRRDPNLSDEDVYQIARNYVIGLLQHITYDEYLPELIGKQSMDRLIGPYKYDQRLKPNVFAQFSAAMLRVGHPLVNSPIRTTDNSASFIKPISIREMFFNPSLVTPDSLNQILNGLARTGGKERSIQIVDDIRNFLIQPPISATIDLLSFNIQRGRDQGICSVKGASQRFGLPVKPISEFFEDQEKAKTLQTAYHDIENVDLWLGVIGEKKRSDSVMGDLGIRLSAIQFQNIRNSDRFWYENAYPKSIVREIKATTFADVLKRNSQAKLINNKAFKCS